MDAVILAGGKGTRMEREAPKALAQVKGKPILEWQLDYVLPQVDRAILSLGHRSHEVQEFVQNKYGDKNIVFSTEPHPSGTAGGLRLALEQTKSPFALVLNCDDLANISIPSLQELNHHTICVAHPRLPFGLVKEENGLARFAEKPLLKSWVSCGWYVFDVDRISAVLPRTGSLEYDVFPQLQLRIYRHTGFWQPLNSMKDIQEAESKELDHVLNNQAQK